MTASPSRERPVPDLIRLIGKDDEPGRQAEAPPRQPGRIPAGPREPASTPADWIRASLRRRP